jgi:putative FmdB family regulatory protein
MPIYVFRCDDGHDFEKLIPMSGGAPECPECGHSSRKIPTTFGIRSSGSTAPDAQRKFSPSSLWREAFKGKPDKVQRELDFRRQLAARGKRESNDIPSPDRNLSGGVPLD